MGVLFPGGDNRRLHIACSSLWRVFRLANAPYDKQCSVFRESWTSENKAWMLAFGVETGHRDGIYDSRRSSTNISPGLLQLRGHRAKKRVGCCFPNGTTLYYADFSIRFILVSYFRTLSLIVGLIPLCVDDLKQYKYIKTTVSDTPNGEPTRFTFFWVLHECPSAACLPAFATKSSKKPAGLPAFYRRVHAQQSSSPSSTSGNYVCLRGTHIR